MDEQPSTSGRGPEDEYLVQAPTSLGPKKLLELCEQFYVSFEPAKVTLDTHAENCVVEEGLQCLDDQLFVRQVLYGTVRYRKFLSSLMESFYYYNSGTALRPDRNMYMVFAYLTLFRLDELSSQQYRRLVAASDPQKVIVFMRYVFNEEKLREVVRDDWLRLYDKEFVDSIIATLLRWGEELEDLMEELEQKVYLNRQKEEAKKNDEGFKPTLTRKTTKSQPFNLTMPKPKLQGPVDEPLPPPVRPKPPPKFIEGPTKEERAIEAAKAANRKAIEAKYSDPRQQAFKLKTLERPTNIEKIRAEVEELRGRDYTYAPTRPRSPPLPPTAQVKLNAAAILREDALYRRKQAEEADMLKRFEAELHDASEFKEWQSRMLAADQAQQDEEVERRRQEMAAAQESAIRARSDKVAENLEIGRQQKEVAKQLEGELRREREQLVKGNQQKREQVISERVKVEQAQEKLAADRKAAAEDLRRQEQEASRAAAEAAARDLAEKRDIIMQLRALEKAPRQRVKEFDPTDSPDHGLLDQMSLLELRERLNVARQQSKDEEERQRSRILTEKQEREAALLDKAANIQRIRKLAANQAQMRKASTTAARTASEERARAQHEAGALDLHGKLEAKRSALAAERSRIAAEEKRIRFEQMQAAAGAAVVEEAKFSDLRGGAQREIKERQSTKLASATLYEHTKSKAQKVRINNVKTEMKAKSDFMRAYDEKIAALTMESAAAQQADFMHRKELADSQRGFEGTQREKHQEIGYKPFTESRSTMQARLMSIGQGTAEL